MHTPTAHLAFLSACATGRGSENLPDEAIHTSAAFQLAGYPHVIATLWPTRDYTAARLAKQIHHTLRDHPDAGPARALHTVTRALRDTHEGQHPALWASHIHSGA